MRKVNHILLSALLLTLSCDPEPVLLKHSEIVADGDHTGIFVLSEGLFNRNNSTLAWIDFETGAVDSWKSPTGTSYDCFEKVNGRRLGDTANDMILYGSRLYIVVSESSTIDILDATTLKSVKQIPMSRDGRPSEPRRITASGDYVYVCSFDGTVTRIDTLLLTADRTINVGRNPDGICVANGKLYVSNSGGLDFNNPDCTVSVIDLNSFTETKRIEVRQNPGSIYSDGKNVFVVSRGIYDYGKNDYDTRLHKIDAENDVVTETFNIPILTMDAHDGIAWFYGYGPGGTIQMLDLERGEIINSDFITDGTRIQCPYGIRVEPRSGKVYVCDAADYVTPGSLFCFSPEGRLLYKVTNIGINPNTITFCDNKVTLRRYAGKPEPKGHVDRVFEYMPAPGQFVNLMPQYEEGDDAQTMAQKCLEAFQSGEMITLGAFGGYVTVGLRSTIHNLEGKDFRIDGNAFNGSSEPGVVWVSSDENHNGLPDDKWYEIEGSEQKAGRSVADYTISYTRPAHEDDHTPWTGSDGRSGSVLHNKSHSQYYYPLWYESDAVEFTGTLLPDNMTQENDIWIMKSFEYGYVDNLTNNTENALFDIEWAVNPDGTPANLESIDFIRIQNGVIGCNERTGELSTEVSTIYNLNPKSE